MRSVKLAVILLAWLPVYAALPATLVYEVRPTVGSDTANSGCFDSAKSGTDFSQQNSAQYNATDLVIGATTTNVTSASHSFVSADVGNCLVITAGSGFTAGTYEITSVSTGTAVLDRSAGTTLSTGGTYAVGGGLATISQANSTAVLANTVWVKATGTYTVTSALTITLINTSSPGNPYSIIGYTSTRGDGGQVNWTTSTNSINIIALNDAANVLIKNFNISSTAGTRGVCINTPAVNYSYSIMIDHVELNGCSYGIFGNEGIYGLFVMNSRITASVNDGINNFGNTYIFASLLDHNTGNGAQWAAGGGAENWTVVDSVFYDNGASGLLVSYNGESTLSTISIYNSDFSTNTTIGLQIASGTSPFVNTYNCVFDNNGTYGFAALSSGSTLFPYLRYNNAFYNNTTANTLNLEPGENTITLTANPYTSASGLNFALNSTSGGGAALISAGFPGVSPFGTGTMSVGAVQGAVSGGSGGQVGYPVIQ